MYVVHSDCYKNNKQCQYCLFSPSSSSISESTGDNGSDSQQLQQQQDQQPQSVKNLPVENNSNVIISSSDLLPEPKKQRTAIIVENVTLLEDAENRLEVTRVTSASSPDQIDNSYAEPKSSCDHVVVVPFSSVRDDILDEKAEHHLQEEKDPIMSTDLVVADFDTSLVYSQARVELLIQNHTFIGSANLSSCSKKNEDGSVINNDTVMYVEYQGDSITGCFSPNGDHIIGCSGGQRRKLYGPVYTVRKYKPSTDEEMVYAVILWIDAAIKDKVEIEITSLEDYFQLLSLS